MGSTYTKALADAIVQKDAQAARDALQRGADPSGRVNGTTPMHLATMTGSGELLRVMLDAAGNPNVRDSIGRAPLHYAAMGVPDADTDLVQLLLSSDADANAADDRGCTPLDLAAGAANVEAASVLARAGATCRTDRRSWVDQVSKASGPGKSSSLTRP